MITKMTAYQSSDGKFVGSLEQVQRHELTLLLESFSHSEIKGIGDKTEQVRDIQLDIAVNKLVESREKVVDILTTGPKSRPKARTANGATRKRTPRATATPPSTPAGTQA